MTAPLRSAALAAALALPLAAHAQNELSNFTATGRGGVVNTFAHDYQVIGINPANLGRESDFKVAFTIGEFGAGLASQSLNRALFRHILYDTDQSITPAQRAELVAGFTGKDVLNFNADVTSLGLAVTLPNGLGAIAVSNRQRVAGHLAFNANAADVLINGRQAASLQPYYAFNPVTNTVTPGATLPPTVSQFLDGTDIQLAWTSEYNLAYGLRVLDYDGFKLSAGAGYRYIQGIGIADVRVSRDGGVEAYNALSPLFKIKYGNLGSNPSFNLEAGTGLQPVGHGHGYDLGLAAEVGKLVRLGVSVVDLGSMTWTGNVLTAKDQKLQQVNATGVNTYNVIKEISNQFSNEDASLFSYEPAKERTASLPAKLRLGGGIRVSDLFEAGLDVTLPLNKVAGNLTSPFVGVGADFKPVRWLRLSSGVTGGAGYGASLPLGVTFVTPIWEAGVSTRDVTGYFNDKSPYNSLALGLLRFKLGGKD